MNIRVGVGVVRETHRDVAPGFRHLTTALFTDDLGQLVIKKSSVAARRATRHGIFVDTDIRPKPSRVEIVRMIRPIFHRQEHAQTTKTLNHVKVVLHFLDEAPPHFRYRLQIGRVIHEAVETRLKHLVGCIIRVDYEKQVADEVVPKLVLRLGSRRALRVRALVVVAKACLLYTSPSPRDKRQSRMPSSA